jgi:molybdopterin adenylyltransferase
MSNKQHKLKSPKVVPCMVITISDTRTEETDKSGKLLLAMLEEAGHKVVDYVIVKDEREPISRVVEKGILNPKVDVILTNGGTGIAQRDVTIETVSSLFDKEIPGFGELFRMLSYQEDIGSAALLSRAVAGVAKDTVIVSMPGSTGAVKLAMSKLILPELGHLVHEVQKDLKQN